MRSSGLAPLALIGCTLASAAAIAALAAESRATRIESDPSAAQAEERVEVPPPPFSDGIFPCSECHESLEVNRERRELTDMHEDIVLRHDEEHRWCLDCHSATDRDMLHLASGATVSFDESYLLCGQCHGEKLRDWRAGIHGRRSGNWNGRKTYLLCAHCHNPHQPQFQPLEPMPAPEPPTRPTLAEKAP